MRIKTLNILLILLVFTIKLFAQIPDGYYDTADGKTGENLKQALYSIINEHTEKSYGNARYILDETDVDPANSNNVLVIYSNHSVSGIWDSGTTWNREHVWAKSHGIGDVSNSTKGAGSDLHNLRACIPAINSARNNRWFAECNEPYFYNDTNTDSYTSSTNWVWKPRNKDKGDVARIIFYMATRYEGEYDEPDLEVINYLPANNYTNEPIHALLTDLLKWHIDDPVSEFEQHRNNIIYTYQKNRNPFIDHPEFVDKIWGTTTIVSNKKVSVILYPNPAKTEVNILSDKNFNSVIIFNIIGRKVKEYQNIEKSIYIGDLLCGQYIVVLKNKNTSITSSLVIVD